MVLQVGIVIRVRQVLSAMKNKKLLNEKEENQEQGNGQEKDNAAPKMKLKDMKPMTVAISNKAGVDAGMLKRRNDNAVRSAKKAANGNIDKILNTSIEKSDKGPGSYLLTITFKEGYNPQEKAEEAKVAVSNYLTSYIGGTVKNAKDAQLFKKADSTDNTWYLKYTVESEQDMATNLVKGIEDGLDPMLILEKMVSDKILEKLERNGK